MKRLLLHLGLPKTATTTLQHHVFQSLHENGKINFLGKVIDFDLNGKAIFRNYTGGFIRKACERNDVGSLTEQLNNTLDDNKLNVFSDEGIMVSYPGKDNLPLTEKVKNLSEMLLDYDVRVLLTVRQPLNYLFSLYVELYKDFYSKDKNNNTFNKYVSNLLADTNLVDQSSVYMHENIAMLSKFFPITVVFFEDLKYDKSAYIQSFSRLFDDDITEEMAAAFETKLENVKKNLDNGVYCSSDLSLRGIKKKASNWLRPIKPIHHILKQIYRSRWLPFSFITERKFFQREVFHRRPDAETAEKLMEIIGVPSTFNARQYDISEKKLKRYGYLSPENHYEK